MRTLRGKTNGGIDAYRWTLGQFAVFVRIETRRVATMEHLTPAMIHARMTAMAGKGLKPSTIRVRQATVSSFCRWLVQREFLPANPVWKCDRPKVERDVPRGVPSSELMNRLLDAAIARGRRRDIAVLLPLRFTGMRRESIATLRVKQVDPMGWFRDVREKGGRTRDIPVPLPVIEYLLLYIKEELPKFAEEVTPETPLFWSSWGRPIVGRTRRPMRGKNLWRFLKYYAAQIGVPELKPHDFRHGVAMEMYEEHGDLEKVRALLGHREITTTQIYARIRPAELKRSTAFYDERAKRLLERNRDSNKDV
jgi:site-specific recombinase XerD